MTKRMLIDASHPEETRVVVVSGTRVEEFDYEVASKKPLKGNIYLAKITRVEPSLQAAFVDYGGGRHGFLPFSEIHPDYYRIPIADREALIAEEEELRAQDPDASSDNGDEAPESAVDRADQYVREEEIAAQIAEEDDAGQDNGDEESGGEDASGEVEELDSETSVDTVGGDEVEEALRRRAKLLRKYKIQEVIKRRQVLLVQVTKEERGTKGAALTTYLSLAGRYCVLMPNTGKGGGISRKIANASDRRRLKEVLAEMEIPQGMAVIVRTAGSQRTKAEIRRDYDYLLRLWDEIRTSTLESTAPKLIHEEANLIKRAIRDQYARDMDEVLVEGEEGHKAAKAFMKMLMPSHARNVKLYKDETIPLMHKYQVETQLEAMYSTQVRLKSGGSIVINQTEALVAIDVNSGKATKERHIEETALKTNLEAAEEVGRQLRLRDLAGLIVIDFIDMEESRHNRDVERRLKEALKSDRARIQLGRISPFGLLELSRQRLRPSLFETSNEGCPICGGTGFIRSKESSCLQLLRTVTEEAIKGGAESLSVRLPTELALYLLNEHRTRIAEIEQRYGISLLVKVDDDLGPSEFVVGRIDPEGRAQEQAPRSEPRERSSQPARSENDNEQRKRGRRGGRRHKRDDEDSVVEAKEEEAVAEETQQTAPRPDEDDSEEKKGSRRRRRGKRGGRRRSKRRDESGDAQQEAQDGQSEESPAKENQAEDQQAGDNQPEDQQAPASAEAAHDDDGQATAESQGESLDGSPEEKPAKSGRSRRRSPRRKTAKQSEAAETTENDGQQEAAAQEDSAPAEAADAAPEAEAPAKPEKPKRSRSRKPKAKPADSETASAEEAQAAPVESPKQESPKQESPQPAEAAPAPVQEVPAPAPQDSAEQAPPETEEQPKRRGWWNRALG